MGDNFWDTVSDKKEEGTSAPDSLNPGVPERDSPQKIDQLPAAPASENLPSQEMKEGSQWSELEKEEVDPSWGSQHDPVRDDVEISSEVWKSIGLSLAFTAVLIAGIFFVTLLVSGTLEDHSMKDMPQVEATLLEMNSYTETSCSDDGGCTDTLYVEALLVLHCANEEGDTWACGPEKSEASFPFYFRYDSGFFEPVPAEHMDQSEYQETHTVAYDPMDPTRVDLQPGFQFNFEWAIPVFMVLVASFVVGRALYRSDSSIKDGYSNLFKLATGKLGI
ncbi:hypothetical protein N9E21_02530 [Candidatus Poseidoniaceae archaeon]|nr:hypothetical protein [Candidatus Poseidoniaceae archaeon]